MIWWFLRRFVLSLFGELAGHIKLQLLFFLKRIIDIVIVETGSTILALKLILCKLVWILTLALGKSFYAVNGSPDPMLSLILLNFLSWLNVLPLMWWALTRGQPRFIRITLFYFFSILLLVIGFNFFWKFKDCFLRFFFLLLF